jgi:hypothetical protein
VATFETTVMIQAPPSRIISVLCDIERWSQWTTTVTSAKRLDGGSFGEGSRALLRQPKLRPAVWQVTVFEPRRGFAWVTRGPGVQISGEHWVEPEGEGCRVTLSLRFSGLLAPLLAWLYRDLNNRYLAIEAQGLRARCEGSGVDSF